MFDTDPASIPFQRTRGQAVVTMASGPNGARIKGLRQAGSAKAMLPRVHGSPPEVVFLNTAGGLTGGDLMQFSLRVEDGASVTGTTQTAERAYASNTGAAQMQVDLHVGAGGHLDWLPQETILFEHSNLTRQTDIHLAGDASVLTVETLVLGRTAMGEVLNTTILHDTRRIYRDGVPVMIEPVAITPRVLEQRTARAGLRDARALSTVVLAAPNAEDALDRARAALCLEGVSGAASAWNEKLVVRLMAADAALLRRALAKVIQSLRPGPLPRVWQF